MPNLKLTEIHHPPLYVRIKIKDVGIKDLLEIAKNNKNEKKELIWPFPPIDVVNLKNGYEILDGNRRAKVAVALKFKEIPAKILDIKDPAEQFLYQIKANLHGLMLDKDQRDNSIRLLSTRFKMKPETLTKAFKLTKASISRILSSKQRKTGPRRQGQEQGESQETTENFSAKSFLERIFYIAEEFPKHQTDIQSFLKNLKNPNTQKLSELLNTLQAIEYCLHDYLALAKKVKNDNSGKTT